MRERGKKGLGNNYAECEKRCWYAITDRTLQSAPDYPTLGNKLVRSHLTLTDNQLVDVTLALGAKYPTSHTETATLPHHRHQNIGIKACNHPRCCTCKLHLNCSPTFKSNYPRNRTVYHVRHPFFQWRIQGGDRGFRTPPSASASLIIH